MRRCANARRRVHVQPDVAALGRQRRPAMQPHTYAHFDVSWPALRGEGALRLDGSGERVASAGEGGKEGISLRIYFQAAVGVERGAYQPAMLDQDVGGVRTPLLP